MVEIDVDTATATLEDGHWRVIMDVRIQDMTYRMAARVPCDQPDMMARAIEDMVRQFDRIQDSV